MYKTNEKTPIYHNEDWITPEHHFYVDNKVNYPALNDDMNKIMIKGNVKKNLEISYNEIIKMPKIKVVMPLISPNYLCDYFDNNIGDIWASQGVWEGVPLYLILLKAGIKDDSLEVVFTSYNNDTFSLPLHKAMLLDTIIAYKLNGHVIPFIHGFPLRLIVPGWYDMASIKWLKCIEVINHHGKDNDLYTYYPHENDDDGKSPVTDLKVTSIIQDPINQAIIEKGIYVIKGIAFTGKGRITKVELSFDGGVTWHSTLLRYDDNNPYSWTFWKYEWNATISKNYQIMSKAYDSSGRMQPSKADWNRLKYGYNAIYVINVKVI